MVARTVVVYRVRYTEHSFQVSALPFSLTMWEENTVVCRKYDLTGICFNPVAVIPVSAEPDLINVLMLSMC